MKKTDEQLQQEVTEIRRFVNGDFKDTGKAFEKQIDDVYDSIRILLMKNKNYVEQRDMLLPRLMSGKLEV